MSAFITTLDEMRRVIREEIATLGHPPAIAARRPHHTSVGNWDSAPIPNCHLPNKPPPTNVYWCACGKGYIWEGDHWTANQARA